MAGRSRFEELTMPRKVRRSTEDRIIVGGIKFHAYHGLTKLERQVGVRCSIDVELKLDLEDAIGSDSLRDTIDYRRIHALVLDVGRKRKSYHRIESLGGII